MQPHRSVDTVVVPLFANVLAGYRHRRSRAALQRDRLVILVHLIDRRPRVKPQLAYRGVIAARRQTEVLRDPDRQDGLRRKP